MRARMCAVQDRDVRAYAQGIARKRTGVGLIRERPSGGVDRRSESSVVYTANRTVATVGLSACGSAPGVTQGRHRDGVGNAVGTA